MKVFYTKTYNMWGVNARKQEIIGNVAQSLGYKEISLFKFPDSYDSDYELDARIEGILASMENGATVIFQYPSMVSLRYDRSVIQHIKRYQGVRLIVVLEDLGSFTDQNGYPSLEDEIALFQQADLLILQSPLMKKFLMEHGLKDVPAMYQQVWEYPYETYNNTVQIKKQVQSVDDISVQTLLGLKECGIALLEKQADTYADMCIPLAMGYCICAGIPILAKKTTPLGQFVQQFGIGFVIADDEQAANDVADFTDDEIRQRIDRINRMKDAIGSGLFTRTLLQDAVFQVLVNNYF